MKKLLILFCLLFFITGCSKQPERTNVQFASWGSKTEVEIIKEVIADFETSHPNIKIDFLHIPQNYFQKIHLLFASNTEPDVLFLNNHYLPLYANTGKLLPLVADEKIYNNKVLESLSWEGRLYAIPRDISLLVIYYNKDLLKKAGIQPPNQNWNFDEFLAKTIEIKNQTGIFGISFEETPLFYLPYVMSEGGNFFELQSPQTKKGLNFYADLRKKYHVAPHQEESASATMAQMFLQEKIAMQLSGRWLTPKYLESANFNWAILPFPKGSNGSVVPLDASGWAISKSTKHKTQAIEFVNYLSSKPVIEKFAKTGLIIPAREDIEYTDKEIYTSILNTAKPTPVSIDYNNVLDDLKIRLEPLFN